jgi:IclR family acetate operon transcriptional repressor
VARIGRPSVAHATAIGKVYLANGGELPPGQLPAFTARTITDRKAIAEEVALTAERGYATAMGEREDELNAIAAPVLGPRGELAAILGVQGPASRFGPRTLTSAVPVLVEHARAISAELGSRAHL